MQNKDSNQKSILTFLGKENDKISELDMIRDQNRRSKAIVNVPHPFLKWAGGKRQLISQMDKYFPREFNRYIEPFVGGGTVFFYLLPKRAILIDNNTELINSYIVISRSVNDLINSLKKHKNEKDYFYKIRSVDRNPEEFSKWSDIEKASRTIYMNRCCYNGLYRVNSKGEFNVPFGKYKNPNFCDKENLLAVHKVLKKVKLINDDFEICLKFAEKDDFIYFDPPYHPLSETASFTSYTKENFDKKAQGRLFTVFKELDKRGCKLMLSNSYNNFILDLYENYEINILQAARAINSDPTGRGRIKEVLITNTFE